MNLKRFCVYAKGRIHYAAGIQNGFQQFLKFFARHFRLKFMQSDIGEFLQNLPGKTQGFLAKTLIQ